MTDTLTASIDESTGAGVAGTPPPVLALVIAWARREPGRLGETAIVPPGTPLILGRHSDAPEPLRRLDFGRHRPATVDPRPPLTSPGVSRRQLLIEARGAESLNVRNVGRAPLFVNGTPCDSADVLANDTLRIGADLLLLCVRRPAWLRSWSAAPSPPFGAPDTHGIVGESAAAWELRRHIAFAATRREHVLVVGESGTGKELAARAVHALSARPSGPFIARNAATFPEALVDAELFGHARHYPTSGMPERRGLLGEAAGGTLFLDEIAELPASLQTHLLRVLDAGEYQRLGDALVRRSDARFIAATNRPEGLRADVAARFTLGFRVPCLNERREDIPLLVVHALRRIADANPELSARLYPAGHSDDQPRASLAFVERLVRHSYVTNVRELERELWRALVDGPESILDAPASSEPVIQRNGALSHRASTPPAPRAPLTPAAIETALEEHGGNLERTWRALGLTSRHVLTRLMAKNRIAKSTSRRDAS